MRKILAFTLAETLIVMGIIGIVSALTLPNLNASTGEKEKVAKVKKIHSNLQDAFGRAIAIYGPMDEWERGLSSGLYSQEGCDRIMDRLSEFLKVSKSCGNTITPCFKSNTFNQLHGSAGSSISSLSNSLILADGTSIGITYVGAGVHTIFIDIDGPNKGQNAFGRDVFAYTRDFSDNTSFFKPAGFDITTDAAIKSQCFASGSNCMQWVITNDNMDYTKADKDGKCSNGKILTLTNISCK